MQLQYYETAQAAKAKSLETNGMDASSAEKNGDFKPMAQENAWVVVSKRKNYMPQKTDVGHRLQFRVSVVDTQTGEEVLDGHKSVMTKTVRCIPEPAPRRMVPLFPSPGPVVRKGRFTVLTYNILAELYATREQFPMTQAHALRWDYRRQIILRELAMYDADIVCLQEVQSTSFYEDLKPEMDRRGYDAVFKKKTQDDVLLAQGNRYAMDGCATFFRRSRFTSVKKYEVEFNKAAQSYADQIDAQDERRRGVNRLMKHNVALILVLEDLLVKEGNDEDDDTSNQSNLQHGRNGQTGPRQQHGNQNNNQNQNENQRRWLVCVANTHIHANQDLADVKLWQVQTLLKGLEKIANSANIPMIVAGDLNSVPGSAPHTLMVQQQVDLNHPDLKVDPLRLFRGVPPSRLTHSLQLRSAYMAALDCNSSEGIALRGELDEKFGEPKRTNVTHDFKETLDYIVYSSNALQPTALLELPSVSDLLGPEGTGGLPNSQWPSDHIALMAEFSFPGFGAQGH